MQAHSVPKFPGDPCSIFQTGEKNLEAIVAKENIAIFPEFAVPAKKIPAIRRNLQISGGNQRTRKLFAALFAVTRESAAVSGCLTG